MDELTSLELADHRQSIDGHWVMRPMSMQGHYLPDLPSVLSFCSFVCSFVCLFVVLSVIGKALQQ